MKHQFLSKHQIRRDFCRNLFRRMEMPCIHTNDTIIMRHRIIGIKFMRTRHITFTSQTKKLALHRINIIFSVQRHCKNLIQRVFQKSPRSYFVNGMIFVAVTDPVIGNADLPQFFSKVSTNLPAFLSVLNPILPNALISAAKCKSRFRHRM